MPLIHSLQPLKELGKRAQKSSISLDTERAGGIQIVARIWRNTG